MRARDKKISFGVILGSGLNSITESYPLLEIIKNNNSGVHKKNIYISDVEGKPVLFFSGRNHIYEGSTRDRLIENISWAKKLGVKYLLITNAAGGLNINYSVSDLMLIKDHINFSIKYHKTKNFYLYDSYLKNLFEQICLKEKLIFREGIYGCLYGPVYETPSETHFYKKYNIDALGMSTIPEVNKAHSSEIKVIAVSVITNLLRDSVAQKITHDEVIKAGLKAISSLKKLINGLTLELN